MYPHRIRLRGPWECEPLESIDVRSLPSPRRLTMPCRWAEAGWIDFAGRALCRRRFGYPGRIDAHERIWLTFAGISSRAEVTLNQQRLGGHEGEGPFEFEITSLLRQRNELVVLIESADAQGGLWGEVALEIRSTAFLREVRFWDNEGRIHVSGEVVGSSERPLDLYVLRQNSTVAYMLVEAGRPFFVTGESLPGPGPVRVELVDGATVWYAVELPNSESP
jgi:hypothetical protein